jgi:hypothetical protein
MDQPPNYIIHVLYSNCLQIKWKYLYEWEHAIEEMKMFNDNVL